MCDLMNFKFLFLRNVGRRVPPLDILSCDFGTSGSLSPDFNWLARPKSLYHESQLMGLLVKFILVDFAVLQLINLHLQVLNTLLMPIKQLINRLNLLLLLSILLFQSLEPLIELVHHSLQLLVKLLPELVLDVLQRVEQVWPRVVILGPVHLLYQVYLALQVIQPLVVLLLSLS